MSHPSRMIAYLALIGGCIFHRPSTSGEQFKAAVDKDWGGKLGHLDGNMLGIDGHDEADSPQIQSGKFTLLGLIDGELCFSYTAGDWTDFASPEEQEDRRMKFMESSVWVFEAHDSEATIRDGWPEHAKTSVRTTTLQDNKIDDQSEWSARLGHVDTNIWVETRIENCGPAPRVTANTKYITISWFGSGTGLLVWKVDEPINPQFLARQDEQAPSEAAPEVSDEFEPGTDSIMDVLAAAGTFTHFTRLAAEVGLDKELETGGPYMVFAQTDAMLAEVDDSAWRDKQLLHASLASQIVEGVVTADTHEMPTLGGRTRTITFDDDGSIEVQGARGTITRLGAATNAVIYRVE